MGRILVGRLSLVPPRGHASRRRPGARPSQRSLAAIFQRISYDSPPARLGNHQGRSAAWYRGWAEPHSLERKGPWRGYQKGTRIYWCQCSRSGPYFGSKFGFSFGLSHWASWLDWLFISLATAFCKKLVSSAGIRLLPSL
jgi:hypothetical protein